MSSINNIQLWLAKKAATITMALSGVEKNALNQTGEQMSSDIGHAQRHTQGQVVDSLINGEITQEVMDLRWRTYKVLQESNGLKTEIIGYEPDGTPITKTIKRDNKKGLKKVLLDKYDKYQLEMVVNNDEIANSGSDVMDNTTLKIFDEAIINYDEDGNKVSATHGEIQGENYYATNKTIKPIGISSETTRKFFIENYTKKLNVRKISETERLLEFYVSCYPDLDNRTSRIFINDIKKAIIDPSKATMLELDYVGFITYKTIGANDFLQFKYKITSFDKIIEFNGNYVIKFKADVIIDGLDIMAVHIQEELEEKYKNKTKK